MEGTERGNHSPDDAIEDSSQFLDYGFAGEWRPLPERYVDERVEIHIYLRVAARVGIPGDYRAIFNRAAEHSEVLYPEL